jgi:hypothetical protein
LQFKKLQIFWRGLNPHPALGRVLTNVIIITLNLNGVSLNNVGALCYNCGILKQKEGKMKQHELDTTGWIEYPFNVNGINFISKLSPNSEFLPRIKNLPVEIFQAMNAGAVKDLVGEGLTRDEMIAKLNYVNENATHAVIELA